MNNSTAEKYLGPKETEVIARLSYALSLKIKKRKNKYEVDGN